MTSIPDDKATKPSSIVDEMARAMTCCNEVECECAENARAAAAVVARRLREALATEFGPDAWGKVGRVNALLDELEGGT